MIEALFIISGSILGAYYLLRLDIWLRLAKSYGVKTKIGNDKTKVLSEVYVNENAFYGPSCSISCLSKGLFIKHESLVGWVVPDLLIPWGKITNLGVNEEDRSKVKTIIQNDPKNEIVYFPKDLFDLLERAKT